MNSFKLIRMLEEQGWQLMRTKGSHRQYRHPARPELVTVPHPKKDLPIGTAARIIKSTGLK